MSTDPFPPSNECACGKVHAPPNLEAFLTPITTDIGGQPIKAEPTQEDGPEPVEEYDSFIDESWPSARDPEPDIDLGFPTDENGGLDFDQVAIAEQPGVTRPPTVAEAAYLDANGRVKEHITMEPIEEMVSRIGDSGLKADMLAEVAASIEDSKRLRTDIADLERKQLAEKVDTLMQDTQVWLDASQFNEIANEVFDYHLTDLNRDAAVAVGRIGDVILYDDGTAVDMSPDMDLVRAQQKALDGDGIVRHPNLYPEERVTLSDVFGPAHGGFSREYGEETRITSDTGGQKGTKPEQYDDMPMEALASLAKVYAMGAEKYERGNYRKGYPYSLSFSALMRHLIACQGGEDTDPESGPSHLAHAAWHCFTLQHFLRTHPEYDDRQA